MGSGGSVPASVEDAQKQGIDQATIDEFVSWAAEGAKPLDGRDVLNLEAAVVEVEKLTRMVTSARIALPSV